MVLKKALIIYIFTTLAIFSFAGEVKDGRDLIKQMYEKYRGNWHTNIAYEQISSYFNSRGKVTRTEKNYELLKIPGRFLVKMGNKNSGCGHIHKNDTTYVFKDGELVFKKRSRHFVLVPGYDVYAVQPEKTVKKLENMGYDLDKISKTVLDGRKILVIGVSDISEKDANQLWIDKERLYLIKSIRYDRRRNRKFEVILTGYKKFDNKWLSTGMIYKSNDRLKLKQVYKGISFPEEIDEDAFSIEDFEDVEW